MKKTPIILTYVAIALTVAMPAVVPTGAQAGDEDPEKTLIMYYSRTGKSSVVGDALQKELKADVLEIRDTQNRSGTIGFWRSALDSYLDRYADIEPSKPDLSKYANIIIISPIWNWNICVPIRTLISRTDMSGKKLVVFTTANIDIKKYEPYGDDAPFVKRFFRDYLRKKSKAMRDLASASGADIRGHFHVATKDITEDQIRQDTIQYIQQVLCAFSLPSCVTSFVVSR